MSKSGTTGSKQPSLKSLRKKIDGLDRTIQALLDERAQIAIDVGAAKRAERSQGEEVLYYRPEREAQLLRAVTARNKGPMPDETVEKLFREVLSACLSLERSLTIAHLGPAGTYSEAAAIQHFGQSVRFELARSIHDVFRAVESAAADYGIVPVENSIEGAVNQTLDQLIRSQLCICGEVTLGVHHHLLVHPKHKGKPIKRIYSHPQALAQCRRWLGQNWPGAATIEVSSTAEGARLATLEAGAAAIAGDLAAEHYNMAKLARRIEDQTNNRTRFLVLGHEAVPASGVDKTSLLISTHDQPGSLYRVLAPFKKANVNLARIESRPTPNEAEWSYVFFMDFLGHQDTPEIRKLLEGLERRTAHLKILGSYPQALTPQG